MQPDDRIGEYILRRKIGSGQLGEVWQALHRTLRYPVAIKITDRQNSDWLELQATRQNSIYHPYILPIWQVASHADPPYQLMPFMAANLRSRLEFGPIADAVVISILERLLLALIAAHTHGIVHGAIKPENILFNERQMVYLSDFCLGQKANAAGIDGYLAPELSANATTATASSDLYSLGVILLEMVSGQSGLFQLPSNASDKFPALFVELIQQSQTALPHRFSDAAMMLAYLHNHQPQQRSQITVPTRDNVVPASYLRRSIALLSDSAFLALIYWSSGFTAVELAMIAFSYFVLSEGLLAKTPGKALAATKVIRENNAPMSPPLAMWRLLLFTASLLPTLIGFCLGHRPLRFWHDRHSQTLVVRTART